MPEILPAGATAPKFEPVEGPPLVGPWTKGDLIKHVETSMQVELATLPLYFCAMYSVHQNEDDGGVGIEARAHIRSIAEQEMLHLALAGNLLCSLDGKRPLYDKNFMPEYPTHILFDKIPMKLQPANKENLECFIKIEAPYMPPPTPPPRPEFALLMQDGPVLRDYRSIGQFYNSLKLGVQQLSAKDPALFSSNRSNQLQGSEFFDSKMTVIYDQATALEALATIVDQGEGNIGQTDSHYTIFVKLYQQHKRWKCVDYVDEPSTAKYERVNKAAYHLSRAVDASHCFLLQTIDRCWEGNVDGVQRKQLLRNVHQLMVDILSPIAHALVEQRMGDTGKFAAPCFEFYPQESEQPLPPKQLFEGLKKEIEEAQKAVEEGLRARPEDLDLKKSAGAIERIAFRLSNFKEV